MHVYLQAFPNPASTTVNVNVYLTQPEIIHAYVYNSLNVLVLDKQQPGHTGNNLVSLDVHNLAGGTIQDKVDLWRQGLLCQIPKIVMIGLFKAKPVTEMLQAFLFSEFSRRVYRGAEIAEKISAISAPLI